MNYSVRHISGDRYQINLIPTKSEEHQMIKNTKPENLEVYYHEAVAEKLGHSACLLSIEPGNPDRYSVIGKIEYAKGLGGT